VVLSVAPNPEQGRRLSLSKLEATLRRHGRQRNLAARAAQIQALLREPHLELESAKLAGAYSDEVQYLVRTLLHVRSEIAQLEQQLAVDFREHPDAEIYLSLPGLADVLGARVLGESGDDPTRYPNARSRKNYVGNSPVTKASGRSRQVQRRIARNRLLADATFRWAACAINASPGTRRYYEQLKAREKSHTVAVRALANKLTGILHGCLRERRLYDEASAWPVQLHEEAA
jgi:hypothetical protein